MRLQRLPLLSLSFGLILSGVTARATPVSYPSLDPTEYYESLRVGSFNNPTYSFTGNAAGIFTAACVPGDVLNTIGCASVDFESQPKMSLTASVTAYPFDPSLQTAYSSFTQITAEVAYFYEIHGPASATPIPVMLTTTVSFTDSVGNNRSFSIQGAAETRLDGTNGAQYANSTLAIAPYTTNLFNGALPNTEYDIALIANGLQAYNNGTFGIDPVISATAFIDPILTFAPGFDSTGYTITLSDGVGNSNTSPTPEPTTFAMLAGAFLLLCGCRRASGKFPA